MFSLYGFDEAELHCGANVGGGWGGGGGGGGGGGSYLGLAFIVSFFAGGCSYVIGTLLLSNGELSCIVAFSFRL